jgi:hypothetical protein
MTYLLSSQRQREPELPPVAPARCVGMSYYFYSAWCQEQFEKFAEGQEGDAHAAAAPGPGD